MAVKTITKSRRLMGYTRSASVWLPLLSLIFFVVLTGLILWPLTAHLATSVNNEGDDLQQMWSMGWVMHSLTHDPANTFNANIFYPYPNTLAYSDSLLPQAITALPIYLLTNNLILSYNLVLFGSFVLAGWGMFWLVRDLTGSTGAGLFAGTIFAFAPYKIAHLSQLNLLSLQWLPFAFWCLHRLIIADLDFSRLRGPSNFAARLRNGWVWYVSFGIFFVLQSLSSIYYFLYALPLYLIYLVGLYAFERRWPSPALVLKLVLVGVVAALLMWPTLLPYAQVSSSQAAERTTQEVEQFSANYRFYLGVPENNLLWGGTLAKLGGSGGERRLFPGALAYIFALLAIVGPSIWWLARRRQQTKTMLPVRFTARSNRVRYLYLLIGLFALIMSFGFTLHIKGIDIPLPYRLFYDYFPGWKGLRAVVRYGGFVLFAVSVLAGFGFEFIQKLFFAPKHLDSTPNLQVNNVVTPQLKLSPQNLALVGSVLTALLLLATFWEYRSDLTYTRPDILSQPPLVYNWLAAPEHAGPILELPMAAGPDLPSIHDFYSTLNWQPTVGGESGYTPPVYSDLVAATQPDHLLSAQTLAALQGMGVRWLVWHLNDPSMPLYPDQWQKLKPQLDSNPSLKLAYDAPNDKIYELAPDAWMNKISQLVPNGQALYVSDFRGQQPLLTELSATILQRNHPLYGYDRAGYRFLQPAPTGLPVTYGLFAASEDPSPYGFKADEVIWSNPWLKLYQRKDKLLAAYDLVHDPILSQYNVVKDELQLRQEVEGVRFNTNQILGSGQRLLGQSQLQLTFGSLTAQNVTLILTDGSQQIVKLTPGLTLWRSGALDPNKTKGTEQQVISSNVIKIEPNAGQLLYLNQVDSLVWQSDNPVGVSQTTGATLLQSQTYQNGQSFVSTFQLYAPGGSSSHYNFTLDVYKRPWGSANSGHFGTWTVALTGQAGPQTIEFRFDPTNHQSLVSVAGQPANIGAQPLDIRDNPYSAYISLTQLDGPNVSLVGVARLYDFTLSSGRVSEVNILASRALIFQPPLK